MSLKVAFNIDKSDIDKQIKELAKAQGRSGFNINHELLFSYLVTDENGPFMKSITNMATKVASKNVGKIDSPEKGAEQIVFEIFQSGQADNLKGVKWIVKAPNSLPATLAKAFGGGGGRFGKGNNEIGSFNSLAEAKNFIPKYIRDTALQELDRRIAIMAKQGKIPVVPTGRLLTTLKLGENLSPGFFKKQNKRGFKVGQFISNLELDLRIKTRLRGKMPLGIPDGPPAPSPARGLTYRTGRFVNTLQFQADYKNNIIDYYVSYPYTTFLRGGRLGYYDANKLIENTVREVAKQLFNRDFGVFRTDNLTIGPRAARNF